MVTYDDGVVLYPRSNDFMCVGNFGINGTGGAFIIMIIILFILVFINTMIIFIKFRKKSRV
ncbi:hypothetical protein DLH72_01045 [Candidatus Gracilibacteria bacterium]|nr:MAG: hypothetical protein DLH72_01045 [Candidatus Gracilibacteria bacterium]